MRTNIPKIIINFFSLSAGQAISLLINFYSFVLIAKYFNVADFGEFSNLIAIVAIISKFIDFGLGPIIFREEAIFKNNYYLSSGIIIRFVLFLFFLIISNFTLYLWDYDITYIIFFNLLLLSIIISSRMANFRDLLAIPFKIDFSMHIPAIIAVIDNIIFLILVSLLPFLNGDLSYLIVVYVLSNLPGFIFILLLLKKRYNFVFKFKKSFILKTFKEALPLSGFVIFISIYQNGDIVILKNLDSSFASGVYSAISRLVLPLTIIPAAFATTVYPILANTINDSVKRDYLINISIKLLVIISLSFVIIVIFNSSKIIDLVFGVNYVLGYNALTLLFIANVFLFLNFFSLSIFNVLGKQKYNLFYSIIVLLINFFIIILLLESKSYDAPAYAKVISSIIGSFFLITLMIKEKIKLSFPFLKISLWIILNLICVYFLSFFNVYLYLSLSVATLIGSTLILRLINIKEILSLLKKNENLK